MHKDFYIIKVNDEGTELPSCEIKENIDEDGLPLVEEGRGFKAFNDPRVATYWGFRPNDGHCQFVLYKKLERK